MATPSVWLVLPTYNESGTIREMVDAVLEQLELAVPGDHRVLVVDDASPDGTGEIADALSAEHATVEVLHREAKDGLGRAYLAGFAVARAAGARLIVQMDADFSHDPRDIPRLIAAAADADLVLGSRYVPGGGIPDWGLVRRLVSALGSFYGRLVLGVPVRDLTGGFKCVRREVLDAIDPDSLRAQGYVFQIETTYLAKRAGLRVVEIPIVFHTRRAGESKMSPRIAAEAVWLVPWLRLKYARRRFPEPARQTGGRFSPAVADGEATSAASREEAGARPPR